jgi:hypothetical protein
MRILFSLSLFILSFLSLAQGEANIWYFGDRAGLDFNSGSATVLNDGQINTLEGCSTISSSSGQLLFYTDGSTVYDRTHQIMQNGTGLLGGSSSTQSSVIVPNPSNPNRYYIFTTSEANQSTGVCYSEVDKPLISSVTLCCRARYPFELIWLTYCMSYRSTEYLVYSPTFSQRIGTI